MTDPSGSIPQLVLAPIYDDRCRWVGLYLRPLERARLSLPLLSALSEQLRALAVPCSPLLAELDPEAADAAACAEVLEPQEPGPDGDGAQLVVTCRLPLVRAGATDLLPAAVTAGLAAAGAAPVAVGIDHEESIAALTARGFHYFIFGRLALGPEVNGQRTSAKTAVIQLLGLLGRDAPVQALEEVLKREPQLAFDLLRLVNSAANGLATRIINFRHALALLGRRRLQRWLQLLLFTQHKKGSRFGPLLHRAAWRGRIMELLAAPAGSEQDERQDQAFMVGVFSLLDVLIGAPLERLIAPLNLAEEVTGALLARRGDLGALLTQVEQLEGASGAPAADAPALPPIELQLQALGWVAGIEAGP